MKHAAVALLLVAFTATFPIVAQQASGQTAPAQTATSSGQASTAQSTGGSQTAGQTPAQSGGQGGAQAAGPQPVPYSPDEFPLWARDLRRYETISIGAFPIALLVSSFSYQLYRYAQSGFSQAYVPAVLGTGATPLSNQEKTGVLLAGVGLSLTVALADYILGKMSSSAAGASEATRGSAAAGSGQSGGSASQPTPNPGPNR